jgi:hypothetical protein
MLRGAFRSGTRGFDSALLRTNPLGLRSRLRYPLNLFPLAYEPDGLRATRNP